MCVNQNLKSISIVHVNNEASWCCLQCKCSSKNDITTRLCNFTEATIYIPASASLKAVGKQEPFSDGHKPDNSIREHLLQPQPSFSMQCRGCCCSIPCIMQLPACVQLLVDLDKQNEGRSRGWQGLSFVLGCLSRALPWSGCRRSCSGAFGLGWGWLGNFPGAVGLDRKTHLSFSLIFLRTEGKRKDEWHQPLICLELLEYGAETLSRLGEGQLCIQRQDCTPSPQGWCGGKAVKINSHSDEAPVVRTCQFLWRKALL